MERAGERDTPVSASVASSAPERAARERTDEEFARSAAAGDGSAFDAIVTRYQDRVFNLLLRMCASADEAEDLAQETFLNAFRALGTFRQGSRFYTWLFRIAVNAALSRRRQNVRRRAHEGARLEHESDGEDVRDAQECIADPRSVDPAEEMDRTLLQQRVREGLAQIDPDYRSVLTLRELEEMDYDTIAETLELSRAAVKSRLHRARLELARILKDVR